MISSKRKGERGTVAVTVGLAMIALVMAAGAAVDIGRAVYVQRSLQITVDSALKAASADAVSQPLDFTDTQAENKSKRIILNYIKSNDTLSRELVQYDLKNADDFSMEYVPPEPGTVNQNTIAVTLNARVPVVFAGFFIDQIPLTITGRVTRPQAQPLELVLALDITNSMSETLAGGDGRSKLALLQEAATELTDFVMQSDQTRVGIVPFTQYVHIPEEFVDSPQLAVNWLTVEEPKAFCDKCERTCEPPIFEPCTGADGQARTCKVQKCTDVNNAFSSFKGCVPPRGKWLATGLDLNADISNVLDRKYYGKATQGDCQVPEMTELKPKGTSSEVIKAAINDLDVVTWASQGNTYIPNGLIWGWNMLDPAEPLTGASSDTGTIAPRKAIVLISDGANFWTPTNGTGGGRIEDGSAETSLPYKKTLETCTNIKNANSNDPNARPLEIFVVAIAIDDAPTIGLLSACASDSSTTQHFYRASNATTLRQAFRRIGAQFALNSLTE